MHLVDTFTGDELKFKGINSPPFGPGFSEEQVEQAAALELWGSGFKDPGPDCNEFRLIDADGDVIAKKRLNGY